jgi:hypothetical protein
MAWILGVTQAARAGGDVLGGCDGAAWSCDNNESAASDDRAIERREEPREKNSINSPMQKSVAPRPNSIVPQGGGWWATASGVERRLAGSRSGEQGADAGTSQPDHDQDDRRADVSGFVWH